MTARQAGQRDKLRYAADEVPPRPFSLIVGLQTAILVTVPVVVVTTIVVRVADQSDAYLSWAIFASMVIGGILTIVQSRRVGPVGGGNLTVMGASGAAIGGRGSRPGRGRAAAARGAGCRFGAVPACLRGPAGAPQAHHHPRRFREP